MKLENSSTTERRAYSRANIRHLQQIRSFYVDVDNGFRHDDGRDRRIDISVNPLSYFKRDDERVACFGIPLARFLPVFPPAAHGKDCNLRFCSQLRCRPDPGVRVH